MSCTWTIFEGGETEKPRSLKGVTQKDDSSEGVRSRGRRRRRGNGKFNYRRGKDDERANTGRVNRERQNNLWKERRSAAMFSFTRPQEFSSPPSFPAPLQQHPNLPICLHLPAAVTELQESTFMKDTIRRRALTPPRWCLL